MRGFTLITPRGMAVGLGVVLAVVPLLYAGWARYAAIRSVAGTMKTMANASMAYRVRTPPYAFPTSVAYSTAAAPIPGSIVGEGKILDELPAGPFGVTYDLCQNPFCVTATEHGIDVFGGSGTSDTAYYNPVTGLFAPSAAGTATDTGVSYPGLEDIR